MGLDSAHNLDDIAASLLDLARRQGADAADVGVSQSESLGVSARGGALEDAERSESIDFSLRVMVAAEQGFRQASVSASDPDPATLATLAERAMAMAREATPDHYIGLADAAQLAGEAPDLELLDPSESPNPGALLETALALEAQTLAVEGVRQCEGASAGWGRSRVVIAASNGFHRGYEGGSHSISVSAVAGEGLGMERDYAYSSARWRGDLRTVESVGREAGERAVKRLNPRKPQSGAYPVVLDPRIGSRFASSLLGLMNGAAVARGSSYLAKRMGERILPEGVDLIDDPLLPRGQGSRPFDGEGLPVRRKKLIADGVLSEWLLDLAAARQLGLESNGSGGRGGGPGASNAWISAGAETPEALIGEVEQGLYVTELMGRGLNGVTGDYSSGASGFWIESGRVAHPVSEITIAGHMSDMLATLRLADDLTFERRVNAPTMRVESMTIAAQ